MTDLEIKPTTLAAGIGDRTTRVIGAILVGSGRLNQSDVEQVQRLAQQTGLKFGDAAIQLKLVTQEDIEFALARQFNYPILSHGPNGIVAHEVIAAYNTQCKAVEDLRTLRSRLAIGWLKGASRNILAIASPERGDGRSWLAANLATAFAQAGVRTLLIDADMRYPRQHKLFNLNNATGLSALLTGRATRDIARRVHPQLRLFVATAGTLPPNPQELLTRPVCDVVLDQFSEHFDLVVLDTPALTETADCELLAARAGAAVMVTHLNHTRHSRLTIAMESLTRSGVNVIGSVVNEH